MPFRGNGEAKLVSRVTEPARRRPSSPSPKSESSESKLKGIDEDRFVAERLREEEARVLAEILRET